MRFCSITTQRPHAKNPFNASRAAKQPSDTSDEVKVPEAKSGPWESLEAPKREPSIRLNLDIPLKLNDRLAAKARSYRMPKSELVRRLLEWALEEE